MAVEITHARAGAPSKYRLLHRLASGGMADIYLAQASGLAGFERLLVVKRIRREHARDPEFVRMFLQEARIAAQLHHANIVQVFDVDLEDGEVFCAMEYLHGQNLAAIIARERERGATPPLEVSLAVATRVCAGLDHAHRCRDSQHRPLGIVHRDVTPHNVFVTYDGAVKIIDFGIARAANSLGETRVGVLKGKPGYISPEQCRCEPLDARSDLFSVGVLLYELTTGRLPWQAQTDWEYLKETTEGTPLPPSTLQAGYPRALEQIILRALAQRPEERHASAGVLQAELETFARGLALELSPGLLERYLAAVFGGEVAAWQSARRQGLTLAEHVSRSYGVSEQTATEVDQSPLGSRAERRSGRRRLWLLVPGAAALALGATYLVLDGAPPPQRPSSPAALPQARAASDAAGLAMQPPTPPPVPPVRASAAEPSPPQTWPAPRAASVIKRARRRPAKPATAQVRRSRGAADSKVKPGQTARDSRKIDLESMLPR